MTTPEHYLTRHMGDRGYVASCACGWRVTKRTRDDREREARAHELADTLVVTSVRERSAS